MSRPKFLADHDLNEQIVVGVLRRAPTLEFRRVRELGFEERNDAFLLDYATAQGFIVVSHDVNTMPAAAYERLAEGRGITGLFMVQQSLPIGSIIDDLCLVISFALFRPPGSPVLLGFSETGAIFSNTLVNRKCAQESKNRRNMQFFLIFTLENR